MPFSDLIQWSRGERVAYVVQRGAVRVATFAEYENAPLAPESVITTDPMRAEREAAAQRARMEAVS